MFLTLYAHTWAKYETIGSSEICRDKDAIFWCKTIIPLYTNSFYFYFAVTFNTLRNTAVNEQVIFLKRLIGVTGTLFLRGLLCCNRFSYFIFSDKTKEIMTT